MVDEINFIDLACLLRITPDTTLEKFGSAINGAFFDASNLAGTLKQKSLIDFSSYQIGANTIVVSDAGKALIAEAEAKATEPLDGLDQEILFQISGGKRLPIELQNTLNVRSKDLALHIYKLYKQGLLIYELRSGAVDLQLTESGFIKAKAFAPQPKPAAMPQKPAAPNMQAKPQMQQGDAQQTQPEPAHQFNPQPDQQIVIKPKSNMMMYILAVVVVIIILGAIYYFVLL